MEVMEVILFFLGMVFLITYCLLKDKKRMGSTKNKLYFLSLIFAIVFAFIPTTGPDNGSGGSFLYFGIPAQNFSYFGKGMLGFNPLGFVFNFFVFYWFFKLILKVWVFLLKKD
ncbi:hypothetical protein BACCIP111899_02735 [Bacillus rhizoplanae]|uniref:Uncharacterized protein n=2 Tax=Bacillaceae TaxID=186817 RepID=A0ABN8A2T8_9BACI|nr:hypothetical protein BACCIP111899_02735 [Bacillus rhizoplanae]